ncbi:MAG: hypothetical protein WKG06_05170 [Segetibacter sp.]
MKRFLVTILTVIYFTASTGATLHMHYCMGKVFSIDLTKAKDDCSKCGMKTSNHCCNDELKTVKLQDSHNAVTNDLNLSIPVAIVNDTKSSIHSNISIVAPSFATNNNSPPVSSGRSLCIFNCIFRL